MFGKKLLWSLLVTIMLMNAGCCRMWERWCDRPHSYQPAPYCCPAPQPYCPPSCPPPSYSSPAGAMPVPAASGNWARPCP
jgi:hypothetical protein